MSEQNGSWSDTYSVDELLDMIRSHRHAMQPGQLGESVDKISATIATLKAQRDELLIAIKALRGDKPCGHNYTCCCPDDLATAAIANAEKGKP